MLTGIPPGRRGGPPYWFIVGFEQKGAESEVFLTFLTRNTCSRDSQNPGPCPPKPHFLLKTGDKREKFRRARASPNSETGGEGPSLGRLILSFLSKRPIFYFILS